VNQDTKVLLILEYIYINLDHSHLWGPLYPTNNINRIVLQCVGNFTWRVSDCEELSVVGQSHN